MKNKHIVIISTGQPATNPRMIKEANSLVKEGYKVTICYSHWANWAIGIDSDLIRGAKWKAILCGGSPKENILTWYWTRTRNKSSHILSKVIKSQKLQYRSFCRTFDELLNNALKQDADFFIAHNLGALPVACIAAGNKKIPFGFDIEDFNRNDEQSELQLKTIIEIEELLIPQANYCTTASPLISKAYKTIFKDSIFTTINNVFSISLQVPFVSRLHQSKLKLFWFSQTVGMDRGLQDMLYCMLEIPLMPVELILIGEVSDASKNQLFSFLKSNLHTITFINPVSEIEIIKIAADCDLGLALERKTPLNRDICLTNKIFTYLLAGNALVASNTSAQTLFLKEHPEVGFVYEIGQIEKLASQLRYWHQNRDVLETTRLASWTLANQKLNWEEESKKFVSLIDGILNNQ